MSGLSEISGSLAGLRGFRSAQTEIRPASVPLASGDAGGTALIDISAALAARLDAPRSEALYETTTRPAFSMSSGSTWLSSDFGGPDLDVFHFGSFGTSASIFDRRSATRLQQESPEANAVAKHNQDRLTLLARKYVAKEQFSDEERARLEIVSERVRQLLPAATAKDFEMLEHVLENVKRIGASDRKIRDSIGFISGKDG